MRSIAKPYAIAMYEYAEEHNLISECLYFISLLSKCINNERIKYFLNSRKYEQNEISLLLIKILEDCSINNNYSKNFIFILASNRRLTLIPYIYRLFLEYKLKFNKLVPIKIISAFSLSDIFIKKIKLQLENKYRCKTSVNIIIDSSLIGGVIIKIFNKVIDCSLKSHFNKLKCELLQF